MPVREKPSENNQVMIRRSNQLIEAKFRSTLLEKKLVGLAMSRLSIRDGKLEARMSTSDIREALQIKGGGLYDQLKTMSEASLQHFMYIEDSEKKNVFDIIAVIERARYSNGWLVFTFNDEIRKHTLDVQRRYTLTPLSTLLSFKGNHAIRLYELLAMHLYKASETEPYDVEFRLSELKFQLGLIDVNEPAVARAIKSGMDWDKIIEDVVKKPPYKEWYSFKNRVLDAAVDEINGKDDTEMSVSYKALHAGRGGKTVGIRFSIKRKRKKSEEIEKRNVEMMSTTNESIEELLNYTNGDLTINDAIALLTRANNDIERIKTVFDAAKRAKNIRNKQGWMIKAIEEKWNVDELHTRAKKNDFSNFEQRNDYDFDALERKKREQQRERCAEPVADASGFDLMRKDEQPEYVQQTLVFDDDSSDDINLDLDMRLGDMSKEDLLAFKEFLKTKK